MTAADSNSEVRPNARPSTGRPVRAPIDESLRQLAEHIAVEMMERLWDRLRKGDLLVAPEYLSPRQVFRLTGISIKTLEAWRGVRKGPRYFKIGGRVLYKLQDVRDHIEADGPVR